jgi:selenocysteine lyase/cysteine desulfurase
MRITVRKPRRPNAATLGLPELASDGLVVPTVEGRWVPLSNFDHAASASALVLVEDFVRDLNRSACAIKRGDGFPSQEATAHYKRARKVAGRFLDVDEDDTAIVWTNNATGGMNTVAHVLNQRAKDEGRRARVLVSGAEHNAAVTPFEVAEYIDLTILPVTETHDELLAVIDAELTQRPADLVCVTGASNATGEMPDLAAIAAVTEDKHGTPLLGDLAQLAAHHSVSMRKLRIKFAVLSGHKLGAPYGVGVLACPRSFLEGIVPLVTGGGIVDFVYADREIQWVTDVEALNEPGSPPIVGALATAVAMAVLRRADMDRIAARETGLLNLAYGLMDGDRPVPGLETYRMWERDHPKVGVFTFNIDGFPWGLVGAVLAGHFGIATRGGCFCAHILMAHLLGFSPEEAKRIGQAYTGTGELAGAVRLSFGLDITGKMLMDLDWALREIVQRGLKYWKQRYEQSGKGHWRPKNDTRPYRIDFEELTSW